MPTIRLAPLWRILVLSMYGAVGFAATSADTPWEVVTSSDGSMARARHEAAAVVVDGQYYLLGGRSNRPLEVYELTGSIMPRGFALSWW